MVRKASRKPGPKSDAATPSSTSSPRTTAASAGAAGASRRGSRASELKATTRRASHLYQVYDSASVTGATVATAPSPSHAAVVAAAAVLANPSGQAPPPPSSSLSSGGSGGGATSAVSSNTKDNARSGDGGGGRRGSVTTSGAAAAGGGGAGPAHRTRKPSSGPVAGRKETASGSADDTVLPRPYAKGGSYANENPRLIVSEPLPTPTTTTTTTSPASATFRSRAHAPNNLTGTPARSEEPQDSRRKNSSRSLPRDASELSTESGASSRSGAGGRPRALSLPRTRESVGEVLPRLRPVRGNNNANSHLHVQNSGALSGGTSPSHPREESSERLRPSPPPAGSSSAHPSSVHRNQQPPHGSSRPAQGELHSGELREVLSAPPAAFSDLMTSTSPRQPVRRGNPGGGTTNRSAANAAEHPRELPAELEALSDGGGDHGGQQAGTNGGLFMRSMKVKAASAAGPPLPLSPPAVAGKAATKKTWTAPDFNGGVAADEDADDEIWGDPEPSQDDVAGHMFGSTQLLSSLRPSLQGSSSGGGGDPSAKAPTAAGSGSGSAGAASVQPPRQPAAPSAAANRRHPSPPAADGAAASPAYKFNVVLSSGKTATTPIALVAGSGCVQGMRPTMEDAHFISLNATHVRGQPVSLMAVLDGHCGRRVADLGAKWLPHYVLHHAALGENNALALVESILQTDREIFHILQAKKVELEQQRKAGRATGRRRRDVYDEMMDETTGANGGSTLIAAAVCGRMLYVACLGDARAVLYDGQTTIAMSEDHKPGNADESRRIQKCGGFVQFGRVCGILAVSRALGDFEFKFQPSSNSEEEGLLTDFPFGAQRGEGGVNASSSSAAGAGGAGAGGGGSQPGSQTNRRFISNRDLMVSNVADVRQLNLTDASAFLLLACDGLWDVLSNEEATEFVRDFLSYTPDVCDPRIVAGEKPRPSPEVVRRVLNNCCQKLTEFAVDRGSMDNVSAMVLFFHDVVDTVARFNGRQPASRDSRSGGNNNSNSSAVMSGASSRSSRTRQSRGSVQPSTASSSAFELTNNQLKVRNGRVVPRR